MGDDDTGLHKLAGAQTNVGADRSVPGGVARPSTSGPLLMAKGPDSPSQSRAFCKPYGVVMYSFKVLLWGTLGFYFQNTLKSACQGNCLKCHVSRCH